MWFSFVSCICFPFYFSYSNCDENIWGGRGAGGSGGGVVVSSNGGGRFCLELYTGFRLSEPCELAHLFLCCLWTMCGTNNQIKSEQSYLQFGWNASHLIHSLYFYGATKTRIICFVCMSFVLASVALISAASPFCRWFLFSIWVSLCCRFYLCTICLYFETSFVNWHFGYKFHLSLLRFV